MSSSVNPLLDDVVAMTLASIEELTRVVIRVRGEEGKQVAIIITLKGGFTAVQYEILLQCIHIL